VRKFSRALYRAANDAFAVGRINKDEMRVLRRARWNPLVMHVLRRRVLEEAELTGVWAGDVRSLDWDNLLDFLKEMMPFIIELILMLISIFADED